MLRVLLLLSMPSTSQRKVYSIHIACTIRITVSIYFLHTVLYLSKQSPACHLSLKRPSHEIHNLQFFSQKSNQPHPMCRVPAPLIVWHGFYFSKIFVFFLKTANNLCNFAVEYMQLENKNHCGFFSKTMRGQGEVDPDREDFLRWSLGAKY